MPDTPGLVVAVPTHLHVDDQLFGLSPDGIPWALSGVVVALVVGTNPLLISLGPSLQWGAVAACLLLGLAGARVRPQGRDALVWGVVLGRYVLLPKAARWQAVGTPTLTLRALDGEEEAPDDAETWLEDDTDDDW